MSWIYLLIAAIFEIGWPVGFKMVSLGNHKVFWIVFAIVAMALSGVFLYIAQKEIPIGTAYAVWTGIAVIFTFIFGIIVFHDSLNLLKFLAIMLIIMGIVILKTAH